MDTDSPEADQSPQKNDSDLVVREPGLCLPKSSDLYKMAERESWGRGGWIAKKIFTEQHKHCFGDSSKNIS